ncbi:MAG: uroporphyrinogen-III C-methyltransferase [Microlunatus sp.]|nr:uroporphyrinogen-III C-methyltransferase [Microlunatus sp.]
MLAGSGTPGLAAVAALLQAGARLRVIADDAGPAIQDLADRGRLELIIGAFAAESLAGAALVVAASGNDQRDAAVLAAAEAAGLAAIRIPTDDAADPDQQRTGEVILVGGGPGDPGLITVAGLEAIRSADVIAADRLAPLPVLAQARPDAEIIDVGKIPRGPGVAQQTIEELLVDRAAKGLRVVRFKGGDSFVFGRGGEEWQACAAAGIPVTIIPGVTSAAAAPAAAGIPLTHRRLSQGFVVVTGHVPPGDPRSAVDWESLARSGLTLVIMMGMANLAAITTALATYGMDPQTPAAVVADGTLPSMRSVRAPLSEIAARAAEAGLGAPATAVIGAVAGFSPVDQGR